MPTSRTIRCQGAVQRGTRILLVQHREHASGRAYWLLPGGGREGDETEQECVRREVREETHLDVTVERLLLEETGDPGGVYQGFRTYLCRAVGGKARPGHEPEPDVAPLYAIADVAWCDLLGEASRDALVLADPRTSGLLRRIRAALE